MAATIHKIPDPFADLMQQLMDADKNRKVQIAAIVFVLDGEDEGPYFARIGNRYEVLGAIDRLHHYLLTEMGMEVESSNG